MCFEQHPRPVMLKLFRRFSTLFPNVVDTEQSDPHTSRWQSKEAKLPTHQLLQYFAWLSLSKVVCLYCCQVVYLTFCILGPREIFGKFVASASSLS
eukprot:3033211-Amphidinium_carterae.1